MEKVRFCITMEQYQRFPASYAEILGMSVTEDSFAEVCGTGSVFVYIMMITSQF